MGRLLLRHGSGGGGGGNAPSWYTALTKGQWKAIAGGAGYGAAYQNGNRVEDAINAMGYVPGQSIGATGGGISSVTSAWSGAAVDQSRKALILPCNGGHFDYGGNEVYGLFLQDAVPGWRQILAPTPDNKMNYNDTFGASGAQNQDGRPRSMHTGPSWVYGDGKLWLGCQSPASSPSGGNDAWMWWLDMQNTALSAAITAGTPLAHDGGIGPFHNIGASTFPGGNDGVGASYYSPGVYDSVNQMAWWGSGFGYDRTNTWIWNMHTAGPNIGTGTGWLINGGNGYADFSWAVCCPDIGLIVMGDGGALQRVIVFEIAQAGGAAGTWYYPPASVTGTGFYGAVNSSFPWAAYQQVDHSILIGDPPNLGNTVYKLSIPMSGSSYNKAGTWAWSNTTPGGDTVKFFQSNPFGSETRDRCMNKWNKIEDMGDGTSAIVYCGGIGPSNTNAGGVNGAAPFNIPTFILPLPTSGL